MTPEDRNETRADELLQRRDGKGRRFRWGRVVGERPPSTQRRPSLPPIHIDDPHALFLQGLQEFNRGEFFECHETLELLWRAEDHEVRDLYKGILQIGVGIHHLRRNNYHGAVTLVERGIRHLQPFRPETQGVDVEGLIQQATETRRHIVSLGRARLMEFDLSYVPKVTYQGAQP